MKNTKLTIGFNVKNVMSGERYHQARGVYLKRFNAARASVAKK
jgi:hypothetical protein